MKKHILNGSMGILLRLVNGSVEMSWDVFVSKETPPPISILGTLGKKLNGIKTRKKRSGRVRKNIAVIMNLAVNAQDAMPDGGTLTIETGQLEPPSKSIYRFQRNPGVRQDPLLKTNRQGVRKPFSVKLLAARVREVLDQ